MAIKIDKDSLEKAFNSSNSNTSSNNSKNETKNTEGKKECKCHPGETCECDKDEEVGFHKGALNTLAAERNELLKMIFNVEAIMQAHIKRLEELGIKLDTKKDNKDNCPDC